jgi:general secretion pathway protein F/type IV pilus assembly protein PilC
MPEFTYEALAITGQRNTGILTAASEREVMAMLDARGLYPVRIAAAPSAGGGWSFGLGRRVKSRSMAAFYAQLADLIRSGVPLLKSLDILERQSSQPALAEVLREVRAQVADGTSLADAMARQPRAFTELAVSMVRAGQEGGFLEDVLQRIADFTEHQEDLKAKVIGAMAYPIFLAVIGTIILNVLVIFFVPQFEDMFKDLEKQGELPWLTSMLIGTSHFMQSYWWVILGMLAGLVFLYRTWAATEAGRLKVDSVRLRLPLVGSIYLHFALARFTRILGTLLRNGIPILNALKIAKESTGNRLLTQAIEQSAENVTAGDALAKPLAACSHMPRDVVEMISVGEESNSLDKVLVEIADGLEKRTTRQLDLFVRLLEPIMLLVMAGVTLVVVAGLLIPVFKMGSTIK